MSAYEQLLDRLEGVRRKHNTAMARCPAHEDRNPSLSITPIEGQVLIHCHAGCDPRDVLAALGWGFSDLYDNPRGVDYRYDNGRIVHRTPAKTFRQSGNTTGTPQLYRLDKVKTAIAANQVIYVVEGEKDVHALESLGAVATTNPMGAANWNKVDPSPLHGGTIIVVPDVDQAGRKWVREVLASLDGKCQSVEVRAPRIGNDPADHIAAGHNLDDLVAIEILPVPDDNSDDDLGQENQPHNPLGQVLKRSELSSLPKVEQLVDGFISTPATVVLVGGYGVGKTFLAVGLGNSTGTGLPWLGRKVQKRRVLYILGEGAYGFDHRMIAWEKAWNKGELVSDDDLTFSVQPASLASPTTWDAITAEAVNGDYGFVILDTFSSLAPDADETKDAAMTMRRMSNLSTATLGTVMLVHHPGWSDATRTRGGSQFESNADEVLVAAEISKGSEIFTVTRKKVKDGPNGQVFYLRRRPHLGSCVIEEVQPDQAGIPMRERILVVLANMAAVGATGPQILDELGVDKEQRSTFYKALTKLTEDGGPVADTMIGKSRRYFLRADQEDDE